MDLVEILNVSPVALTVPGRGEARPDGTLKVSPQEADNLERCDAWERVSPVHEKPGLGPADQIDTPDLED